MDLLYKLILADKTFYKKEEFEITPSGLFFLLLGISIILNIFFIRI